MADRFGYPRRIRVSEIANNLYFFAFIRLLPMIGNICGGQNWFGRFRVSNGMVYCLEIGERRFCEGKCMKCMKIIFTCFNV